MPKWTPERRKKFKATMRKRRKERKSANVITVLEKGRLVKYRLRTVTTTVYEKVR